MTELVDRPAQFTNDLELRVQIPMVIPKEIKDLRLANQLPAGEIGYLDASEPDTIRLIKQDTWSPLTVKGVEKRLSVEGNGGRRFAGIIFHTPPRTPDENYDHEIERLSGFLKRSTDKVEGIITDQRLGTLFVVEDRGADEHIGWREKQMQKHGLVVDKKKGERSVVITNEQIVTQGRRHKQRSAIDLTKGRTSGNMFSDLPDATERWAEAQGLRADTTRVREEATATKFVLRTIDNLKHGGNTDFFGTDEDGKEIFFSKDKYGVETSSGKEDFKLDIPPIKEKVAKQLDPLVVEAVLNPGHFVKSNHVCFKCRNEGHSSNLDLKSEAVEMPDKSYKQYIFRICATHGSRGAFPAPSHKEALKAREAG